MESGGDDGQPSGFFLRRWAAKQTLYIVDKLEKERKRAKTVKLESSGTEPTDDDGHLLDKADGSGEPTGPTGAQLNSKDGSMSSAVGSKPDDSVLKSEAGPTTGPQVIPPRAGRPAAPSASQSAPKAQPKRRRGKRGGLKAPFYNAAHALRHVLGEF